MSGGVDSSATAALLLEQGYDVIGITLKLWPQDCVNRAEDKCCGPQAVTDARSVCDKLDITYYLIDQAHQLGADFIATGHFARIERVNVPLDESRRRREESHSNSGEGSQRLVA